MTHRFRAQAFRLFVVAALVGTVLAATAQAQDKRAEVFGGYSFYRIDQGDQFGGKNLHGWNGSLAVNLDRRFGIVADFGGHYGNLDAGLNSKGVTETDYRQISYLFGPRIRFSSGDKIDSHFHVLVGGVSANTQSDPLGLDNTDTAFGADFGTAIDVRLTDSVSWRVVQPSILVTRFKSETQANFRLSTGIVVRFGK